MSLSGSRCPSCGRVAVPPEPACLVCGARPGASEVPAEGAVLAWVRPTPEGLVVLVALAGEARILAEGGSPLEVGDPVFVSLTDGVPVARRREAGPGRR